MGPAQVVALEDLCVLKLIGEVEHYSLAQLVLLPWHLRQKLLCSLPVADICQLEINSRLTRGVDMDAVWGEVCTRFLELLSPQDNVPGGAYLVRFDQLPRPKDTVMAMIAKLLLISATGIMATAYALRLCTPEYTTLSRGQKAGIQHFQDKWGIIRTILFCSHLSNTTFDVSASVNGMESFVHIKLFPTTPSWQPKRHSIHFNTRLTSIAEMTKTILSVCNAVPRVLRFRQHDSIDNLKPKSPENNLILILQSILSGIEEFSIDRSLPQKVPFCSSSLQQVLKAVTSPSTASLQSLRVKGVPFFLKEFIQEIATYVIPIGSPNQLDSTKESVAQSNDLPGYTNLRKIEILSCHPEEREVVDMRRDEPVCLLSAAIPSLLGILNSQAQLEEIHIDHLYNLTEEGISYDGFGSLYSSLRDFIRSPHFRFLRIANCRIPLQIAQQLLNTFAHSLTTHPISLDISECSFDITSDHSVSQANKDEDKRHQEVPIARNSLCAEQHKSLAIPYGRLSSMFTLPKVQYKQLQISIFDDEVQLLDMVEYIGDFEPQPKELDLRILSFSPTHKDLGAVNKILALPHLTNFSVGDLGCEMSQLFHHLASALGKRSSTNALQGLSLYVTAEVAVSSYQQVYDTVFSLPQVQDFSLELTFGLKNCRHHFKYLTEAWKVKSRGGKLLNLTGRELDENSLNDFVSIGRQVAENVHAFDKFYH